MLLNGISGQPYNIGCETPEISMMELARSYESAVGRSLDVAVVEYPDSYPETEPRRRCPDITKAKLQLGYAPDVDLDDGLKRFMGWAVDTYSGTQG